MFLVYLTSEAFNAAQFINATNVEYSHNTEISSSRPETDKDHHTDKATKTPATWEKEKHCKETKINACNTASLDSM